MTQTNDTQGSIGVEVDPTLTQHEQELLDTALRESDHILAASLHVEEARRQRRRRVRNLFLLTGGVAMSLFMIAFLSGWLSLDPAPGEPGSPSLVEATAEITPEAKRQAKALSAKGWSHWKLRNFDQAIDSFSKATKLDPKNANSWNGLGWSQFNSGQEAKAIKSFEKCLKIEESHPAALNGLGQIAFLRGEYDQAQELLEKAAPNAPAAWWGLAKLHLLQGNFQEAKKWTSKITRQNPTNQDAQRMHAAAREKKLDDGLRNLIEPNRNSSNEPNGTGASVTAGWRLVQNGKPSEAEKVFQKLLEQNPKNLPAINGLGWALLNSGRAQDAKPNFEKCIKLSKDHPGAMNGLALCLKSEGKIKEAIAQWEAMQKKFPGANASAVGLAQAYSEQKEYAKAIPYWEILRKSNPQNLEYETGLKNARDGLKGSKE